MLTSILHLEHKYTHNMQHVVTCYPCIYYHTCLLRMFVWLLIYLLYQARGHMPVMFASSIPNSGGPRRGGGFVLLFTLYEQVIVTATRNSEQQATATPTKADCKS